MNVYFEGEDSEFDSDEDFDDEYWSDDDSDMDDVHCGSKHKPRQRTWLAIKDALSFIRLNKMRKCLYAQPTKFYQVSHEECQLCLKTSEVVCRPCCKLLLCSDCFELYVTEKMKFGITDIQCPNTCTYLVDPQDLLHILSLKNKHQYSIREKRYVLSKACSSCGGFVYLKEKVSDCKRTKIICSGCGLSHCYSCLMPWHHQVSCEQNQKSDKLLKSWAKGNFSGQPNAQKCPKCKTYIERISGCDHIHCKQCGSSFCYRCGELYRGYSGFGDHSNRFSIFGCKYGFLPNKPFCRKLIRGSLFSTKIFATLVVGTLAVGVGTAALPFYGCLYLFQKMKRMKRSKGRGSVVATPPSNCCKNNSINTFSIHYLLHHEQYEFYGNGIMTLN